MTVSYTPAQNPQEPEPQRSNVQQAQAIAGQQGEPVENPQQLSGLIRRKVVTKTMENSPGKLADLEIENGNIILYRRPNFFLRTVYRPGQKQNPLRKPSGHTAVMPKAMPQQERYIAARDTRLMPKVTLHITKQTRTIPLPAWLEAVIVVLGLAGTFVSHAYNMFNYPHYEQDEGTYVSAAWAILHGQITPYPYGYGHPPLSWIQIAAWIKLTGGFFTFGTAINSARVLMLLIAVGCSLLVYLVTRRLSGSRITGLLAMVIFSLSPLSITFQREVLLDNFATFWLLLSLYFLVVSNSRLIYIASAAISFGIAILSKEVIVILLPAIIYVAWLHTTKFQRKYVLVNFIYIVIAIASGFVLMAILKGELFPYAWHLPWDRHPHLSMLDTLVWQVNRGQAQGSIGEAWNAWLTSDPLLIILGFAPTAFNFVAGWWSRKHLFLALLAISFWILLLRGGVIFAFYIIPLIPLVALNTAMAVNTVAEWVGKLTRFELVSAILIFGVLVAMVSYDIQHSMAPKNVFTLHPALVQTEALIWIRNHVPRSSLIVINPNLYTDLHEEDGNGVGSGTIYPYAHVYWNVALDPEVHDTLLKGNWDRIDYIIADSEMLRDIRTYGGQMEIIDQALNHSVLVAEFTGDDFEYMYIYQVIHKYPSPNVYSAPGSGTG